MVNPPLYKYPAARYVERLVRHGKLLCGPSAAQFRSIVPDVPE
jgi:hypothetical protein